jgi:hypothetical protein
MPLDSTDLAKFAAETLAELDDDDLPADAMLVDAALIVELKATDPDGEELSMVHAFVMSKRNVCLLGLLVRGEHAALGDDDDYPD